jgi:hypothetical protein
MGQIQFLVCTPPGVVTYVEGGGVMDFGELAKHPGAGGQLSIKIGPFPTTKYVCRPIHEEGHPQPASSPN